MSDEHSDFLSPPFLRFDIAHSFHLDFPPHLINRVIFKDTSLHTPHFSLNGRRRGSEQSLTFKAATVVPPPREGGRREE